MGIFDIFPYTNTHELNLDWVLAVVSRLSNEWDNLKDSLDPKITEAVDQWFAEHPDQADALRIANEALAEVNALANSTPTYPYTVSGKVDTDAKIGWVMVKIDRTLAKAAICNNNGSLTTADAVTSVYNYMQTADADFAVNCDYFPSKMMLDGVIYGDADRENVLTYTAYNPITGDFAIFPKGTNFASIKSQGYTYIFGTSWQLLNDGIPMTTDYETYVDPRTTFGWNDKYYFVMVNLGRSPAYTGITPVQQRSIMAEAGALYAVNFDGGGSTQLMAKCNGVVIPVNGSAEGGNIYRNVPLNVHFKAKEE